MDRIWKIAAFSALAGLIAATAACAPPRRFTATLAMPATIPLTLPPGTPPVTNVARHIDIIVANFQPSPSGPVQIVVDAVNGDGRVEIGRFAIYPERAFVANAKAQPQHFSLTVPPGLHLDRSTRLIVHIVPSQGDGEGAVIDIESARLSQR